MSTSILSNLTIKTILVKQVFSQECHDLGRLQPRLVQTSALEETIGIDSNGY